MSIAENKDLRIQIAKDVLRSLPVLNVRTGTFVSDKDSTTSKELQTIAEIKDSKIQAQKLKQHCEVCALGACLLSAVKFTNKFKFDIKFDYFDDMYELDLDPEPIMKKLLPIFGKEQLALIEYAFEQGKGWIVGEWNVDRYQKKLDKAEEFGNSFRKDSERLRAIMKNIIKNDGTFIP